MGRPFSVSLINYIQESFKTKPTELLQEDGFIAVTQDYLSSSVTLSVVLMNGLQLLTT